MAIRTTTHVLKNSDIVNRPLPSVLLKGEPIVNTADGIMYFSGVTTSTNEWTPAGTGTTANFFEVGSNLYDLRLRNRITKYEGVSGAGLVGKFLSGTTNGFVLADITSIVGVDTYVTGFTYSNNVATIYQNQGQPPLSILINSMTGLTVNGVLSATTGNFGTSNINTLNATGGTVTTLGSVTINSSTINSSTLNVTGTETVNNLTITGTGLYNTTATGSSATEIVNFGSLTAYTSANDIYVTGGTVSYTGPNGTLTLNRKNASDVTINGLSDKFTTGATLVGSTAYFNRNDTLSAYTLDLSSFVPTGDTYVSAFTYNATNNTFTIKQTEGEPDLTAQINTVSGLTVSNLTAGRVVYVGTAGLLTDEAGFEYDAGTNTLAVNNINANGNVVVQGDLTVFGSAISAFTSQLYVEDPNVIFNYNPTGSTTITSVNAGLTIQDGSGVSGSSVQLDIIRMQNLTGLTVTQIPDVTEYSGPTGYSNRGWITQLNDIVIRSTDTTDGGSAGDINGVRVLAEFDVLDGGTY
jgi:hypothetical protein